MNRLLVIVIILMVVLISCKANSSSHDADDENNNEQAPLEQANETQDAIKSDYAPGSWITSYSLALQYAKETGKPVLINFTGSDWCSWCIKLRNEVFSQDAFLDYAKNDLILLTIDFPMKKKLPAAEQQANHELASQYGIEGYPTIVLVDSAGKEIARTGYQYGGAEAYVTHLRELLAPK